MRTKYWLNVYGKLAFQNKKNSFLYAERSYRNIDRIIFIDETNGYSENGGEGKFSEFNQEEWTPITQQEYDMIKRSYKEIPLIREAIRINNIMKTNLFSLS